MAPELEGVICKALEKDRNLRYQHASEIRCDLQRMRRDSGPHKLSATQPLVLDKPKWPKVALVALIAASLFAALVAVGMKYFHRGSKFHEKDTIVLADFDNRTGESGWDATLKLALTNDLENSKYLNVLPDQTVSETLKMMRRQPDEHLTKESGDTSLSAKRQQSAIDSLHCQGGRAIPSRPESHKLCDRNNAGKRRCRCG